MQGSMGASAPTEADLAAMERQLAAAGIVTTAVAAPEEGLDDDDREVPTGQVGELVMRGPNITAGYWMLPGATAEAFRGGWFHSGDLGKIDEDGYMTLVDRTPIDYLDFASPVSGLGSKVGIDATNKWEGETTRDWGTAITMDAAVKSRVDAMWSSFGF